VDEVFGYFFIYFYFLLFYWVNCSFTSFSAFFNF